MLFDQTIHGVQIEIGEPLGSQAPYGKAFPFSKFNQIVWKGISLMVDDGIQNLQKCYVGELSAKKSFEGTMRYRRKILYHIQMKEERVPPKEVLGAVHCSMRSFALSAGVGIMDQSRIEMGFKILDNSLMHHPVAVGGSADDSGFLFIDGEFAEGPGSPTQFRQIPLQLQDLAFPLKIKACDVRGMSELSTARP